VTAQIGMVLVGARGFGRCTPNIARGTGLGQSAPLGRGADQQCPFGAPPPVKSLTLGLHRPGSGRGRAFLGAGNLTGSLCGYQKRSTFVATVRREFLRRVKDIMRSYS